MYHALIYLLGTQALFSACMELENTLTLVQSRQSLHSSILFHDSRSIFPPETIAYRNSLNSRGQPGDFLLSDSASRTYAHEQGTSARFSALLSQSFGVNTLTLNAMVQADQRGGPHVSAEARSLGVHSVTFDLSSPGTYSLDLHLRRIGQFDDSRRPFDRSSIHAVLYNSSYQSILAEGLGSSFANTGEPFSKSTRIEGRLPAGEYRFSVSFDLEESASRDESLTQLQTAALIFSFVPDFPPLPNIQLAHAGFGASGVLGYRLQGGPTTYGSAGVFRLQTEQPSGTLADLVGDQAFGFCIDLQQPYTSSLENYQVRDFMCEDITFGSNQPVSSSQKNLIRQLWARYYDPAWQTEGAQSRESITRAVAFHATLLEILGNVSATDAYLLDPSDPTQRLEMLAVKNQYLAGLRGMEERWLPKLLVLKNANNQDYLVEAVPEIPSFGLPHVWWARIFASCGEFELFGG